ncbi:MAG: hypothetical protein AB7O24_11030, partial [Kofleriaceae bacterium]
MDSRLQAAISNPHIQGQAGELIRLALKALEDLKSLDESLYERFVKSRNKAEDPEANTRELGDLWDATFGGLLQMLAFCRSLEGFEDAVKPVSNEPVELDLGESGPPAGGLGGGGDDGLGDFGDFLDGIEQTIEEGDAERWAKVMEKVSSIEYGLRTQYQTGESRLTIALGKGETNQVLGLFDDTQSSACEGVHALVAAIYEGFVSEVSSQTVVPGYLTSLGRALLVRRGLAELTAALEPHNAILQQGKTPDPDALEAIRAAVHTFVSSIVCRAMRAADRWQMVEFDRELTEQSPTEARMTCEGLVKYLESLNSVNQREVDR